MKDVLKAAWKAIIADKDQRSECEARLSAEIDESETCLRKSFNENQTLEFDILLSALEEYHRACEEHAFEQGVSYAIKFITETLNVR